MRRPRNLRQRRHGCCSCGSGGACGENACGESACGRSSGWNGSGSEAVEGVKVVAEDGLVGNRGDVCYVVS